VKRLLDPPSIDQRLKWTVEWHNTTWNWLRKYLRTRKDADKWASALDGDHNNKCITVERRRP
jgi:hypothetical protein